METCINSHDGSSNTVWAAQPPPSAGANCPTAVNGYSTDLGQCGASAAYAVAVAPTDAAPTKVNNDSFAKVDFIVLSKELNCSCCGLFMLLLAKKLKPF